MSAVLPALLAGCAVAVLGGPGQADLRLAGLDAPRAAADRPVVPERAVVALAVAAAAVTGWLVLGPVGVPLLLVGVAAARRAVGRRRRDRDGVRERRQAVEACGALAAELRAGRPPAVALAAAAEVACGPSRAVLAAAAGAARWGGDVPAVLLEAALPKDGTPRTAVPDLLRALAACWQVCARSGSGLALAVERLADGLRARQAQERAVAAALAGPRASAVLLAGLPLGGLALAAGLGARPLHVLLHTPLGLGCTAAGLALDALGLWWTGRLVAAAARA